MSAWAKAVPFILYAVGSLLFFAGSAICLYRIFTGD